MVISGGSVFQAEGTINAKAHDEKMRGVLKNTTK